MQQVPTENLEASIVWVISTEVILKSTLIFSFIRLIYISQLQICGVQSYATISCAGVCLYQSALLRYNLQAGSETMIAPIIYIHWLFDNDDSVVEVAVIVACRWYEGVNRLLSVYSTL